MTPNLKLSNVTWTLNKDERGNFLTSANVSLNFDVFKLVALYNFSIPSDNEDREFKKMLIKSNLDVCRMAKGNRGDKIGRFMMDEIAKYADFDMKCPINKVKN
jgi:hypothetical protein